MFHAAPGFILKTQIKSHGQGWDGVGDRKGVKPKLREEERAVTPPKRAERELQRKGQARVRVRHNWAELDPSPFCCI